LEIRERSVQRWGYPKGKSGNKEEAGAGVKGQTLPRAFFLLTQSRKGRPEYRKDYCGGKKWGGSQSGSGAIRMGSVVILPKREGSQKGEVSRNFV